MSLSARERKILWTKAGNRCSYRYKDKICDEELVISDDRKEALVGEECHIVGKKPLSPRYIPDFPERDTYSNLILMCPTHHKIIDGKENEDIYTMEVLRGMKKAHGESIAERIKRKEIKPIREKGAKELYEEYFISISKLRQREFEHLGYWVDLYAMETKLTSLEERGKTIKAIELINECVESGRNALVFGQSGSGKTFTSLKLFESLKEKYYSPEAALNERIPLFVELSQMRNKNDDLKDIIRGKIDEAKFNEDKDKYIIFLDGLNEVGDFEEQERIFGQIKRFNLLNLKTRLFVTTQTLDTSYKGSERFLFYEIQPFKKDDIIEYLARFEDKFNSKKEAEAFYKGLTDLMKDFISIPIFLNILVSTYKKEEPLKIDNPGRLFEKYEDFLCGPRESEPLRARLDEVYRRHFTPFLAFHMCEKNEKKITWERFNEYVQNYKKKAHSFIDESKVKDALTTRFKLMRKDEDDNLEFMHQRLRDYFAAVYMKNPLKKDEFSPENIFNLIYTDSTKNNDLINALRLLAGIVKPEISKDIIHKFIKKDLYLAGELFAWSSITSYEKEFIDLIDKKIDINSREYLLNLNEAALFYLKVLDLLQKAKRFDESISAFYMQSLGNVYQDKLDYEEAIKVYEKAISIYEKNKMQTHPDYARCQMNLGLAYGNKLDYEEAIKAYKKAIEIYEENRMQTHPEYAGCHMNLGIAYGGKLDYEKAIEAYEKAIKIYEENKMQHHPEYAKCHVNLGNVYGSKLDYEGAIEAYKKAIKIYEENRMQHHPEYARCHMNLGNVYQDKLDYEGAIGAHKKAIRIYEENRMQHHPEYARCHMNLGIAYRNKLNYEGAIKAYKKAIEIYEKNKMQRHPSYALCHINLGVAYYWKLDYEGAIEGYKKAIEIYEENKMQTHPDYAVCHMNLGIAYGDIGKKDEAVKALELALRIFEESVGKGHPYYKLCLKNLGKVSSRN